MSIIMARYLRTLLLQSVVLCSLLLHCSLGDDNTNSTALPDISWGVATSAYQVEGAWNLSGKGESIWDKFVHDDPSRITDYSNGDVACDSYDLYQQDIELLKELGVDHYRFSIAWSRVLPNGSVNDVNEEGVQYYKNLIDELLDNDITPLVTIYHWDLPQAIDELGGWLNETVVDYFGDYARFCFSTFGDKVKWWITVNEPDSCSWIGYGEGRYAPGIKEPGIADYQAGHNFLKAHARGYHIYDDEFRSTQNGRIGISLPIVWYRALEQTEKGNETAQRALQFSIGWFANPIFSTDGDYPEIMREMVYEESMKEGRTSSRLPTFSQYWVEYIRGTADFFGLNHYTTYNVVASDIRSKQLPTPYVDGHFMAIPSLSAPRGSTFWMQVIPSGLRETLVWIKNQYNDPEIFITENGYCDSGEIDDYARIDYHDAYITQMTKAINEDGVKVIGYTAWALMDNFEWSSGYSIKYGFYAVNFSDPSRTRVKKKSAQYFADLMKEAKGISNAPSLPRMTLLSMFGMIFLLVQCRY